MNIKRISILLLTLVVVAIGLAYFLLKNIYNNKTEISTVGIGWSGNLINTAIFRKNSLTTFNNIQFISYYNQKGSVIIGKRELPDGQWTLSDTGFVGNTKDAHNSISIAVDGAGYVHMSWDQHGTRLNYARSDSPYSLSLKKESKMSGVKEDYVTYPEFYRMPDGGLIFIYRSGVSGNGDIAINKYDIKKKEWIQIQSNLIDGEEKRNAYTQAYVDNHGVIYLSWVWRESGAVETNHDIAFAKSLDKGYSWVKSNGEKYKLPITQSTAEYAIKIPQNSELINQTSMTADSKGNPYIVSYWSEKGSNIPQYHIIYNTKNKWESRNLKFRKTPFTLSGKGTIKIPISRPQILLKDSGIWKGLIILFRDEERGSNISVATSRGFGIKNWDIFDITQNSVGEWEPTFDVDLWRDKSKLSIFSQDVEQVDSEGISSKKPSDIQVLTVDITRWRAYRLFKRAINE